MKFVKKLVSAIITTTLVLSAGLSSLAATAGGGTVETLEAELTEATVVEVSGTTEGVGVAVYAEVIKLSDNSTIGSTNFTVSGDAFSGGIKLKEEVTDPDSIMVRAADYDSGEWKEAGVTKEYAITVTTEGTGTASASASKAKNGTEITLTAAAGDGYEFKEWKVVSGGVTVTDNKFELGKADVEIKAVFEEEETEPVQDPDNEVTTVTYTVVSGGDATWTKGDPDLVLTIKRSDDDKDSIKHLVWVAIDGVELKEGTHYTVKSGSVILTFMGSYLETLSAGKHNIVINFDDASVATTLTIKANTVSDLVKTGEGQKTIIVGALMVVAAAGIIVSTKVMRRKEHEEK